MRYASGPRTVHVRDVGRKRGNAACLYRGVVSLTRTTSPTLNFAKSYQADKRDPKRPSDAASSSRPNNIQSIRDLAASTSRIADKRPAAKPDIIEISSDSEAEDVKPHPQPVITQGRNQLREPITDTARSIPDVATLVLKAKGTPRGQSQMVKTLLGLLETVGKYMTVVSFKCGRMQGRSVEPIRSSAEILLIRILDEESKAIGGPRDPSTNNINDAKVFDLVTLATKWQNGDQRVFLEELQAAIGEIRAYLIAVQYLAKPEESHLWLAEVAEIKKDLDRMQMDMANGRVLARGRV
jgi:hypothetical protein